MIWEHIIGGLFGGILASILLLAVAFLWRKAFVPWVENRLYSGPRIDGVWQTTITRAEGDFNEHAELQQFGYRIKGSQVYPKDRFGRSHTYSVEGEFRDRTLALVFHETGLSEVDSGAIVLDYKTIGPEIGLEGYGVWRDHEGKLVVEAYKWTKGGKEKVKAEQEAKSL